MNTPGISRFPLLHRLLSVLVAFLFVLLSLVSAGEAASANYAPGIPTTVIQEAGFNALAADFGSMTWAGIPPIKSDGSFEAPAEVQQQLGYDPSRSWTAGQTADEIAQVGDTADVFNPQLLDLESISSLTGIDLSQVSLGSFQPLQWQTASDIVRALPQLGNLPASSVPPINDLAIHSIQGFNPNESVGDLLNSSDLGTVPLGEKLDLDSYSLDSIPGLTKTPIENLKGWQAAVIKGVPGLNQVPFGQMPSTSLLNPLGVGKIDVVYGSKETSRQNTISGSFTNDRGFQRVSCKENCAYLELSGADGVYGKQWISGKHQKVEGGSGLLKVVNGGKEPTGRIPYGPGFKIVVTDVDESKGTADFAMYMRKCTSLGCTPYFIGPFPWMSFKEKEMIFVGADDGSIPVPSGFPVPQPPSGYGLGDDEGGFDSDICLDPKSKATVNKILAATPQELRSHANKSVPLILEAAAKAKVTDPAQIAYILGTAQHESNFGMYMSEIGARPGQYGSGNFWGRGFVQLTWIENYQMWSKRTGKDLVGNPDLVAKDPKLASRILVEGMRDGTFTGVKLGNYINGSRQDFFGARAIVNDGDRNGLIANYAQRYLSALKGTTGGISIVPCSGKGSGGSVYKAAQQMMGMDTSAGPDAGNLACAWAVNKVLVKAGHKPLGANTDYVPSVEADLQGGRGELIGRKWAKPGDVVIAGSQAHIGLCMNQGCTQVLSNSSSRAKFSWRSGTDFDGYYGGSASRIYRLKK